MTTVIQTRAGYPEAMIAKLAKIHDWNFVDSVVMADYDVSTKGWHALADRLGVWAHRHWLQSERILLQHFETEFFVQDLGLATHNFISIQQQLDIDPVRFVVLTNHYGSQSWWQQWGTHTHNQFHVEVSPMTKMMYYAGPWPEITHAPSHHFCSMLRQQRSHRDLLARFLLQHDLVRQNVITCDFVAQHHLHEQVSHDCDILPHMHFLITDPASRVNDRWNFDHRLRELYGSGDAVPQIRHPLVTPHTSHWAHAPWYQEIFLDIVSETVFAYPFAFVSEKSLRPMVNGRPMIVFGAAHTLCYLHDMGFKTFSDWWDESYDSILDPNQRFARVCDLIEMISSWSMSRCATVLRDMNHVLNHNQQRMREIMQENFA